MRSKTTLEEFIKNLKATIKCLEKSIKFNDDTALTHAYLFLSSCSLRSKEIDDFQREILSVLRGLVTLEIDEYDVWERIERIRTNLLSYVTFLEMEEEA